MTLRLVAASTDEPAQEAVDVSKKPNDSTRELPNSAKAQLRHGEAVVWWEDKKNFAWQPTAIAAGAGLAIFGLVSLIVPQLWHADISTWVQPLLAVLAPAALLATREYFARSLLVLTDQGFVEVDYRGQASRLNLGDILATKRDLVSGGIKLLGKASSVTVVPAHLDAARREFAKQMRVRSSAIAFHKIDDNAKFFPIKKT